MLSTNKIPLSVPHLSGNEWLYVKECLDTGWVSSVGSYVNKFESAIATACQSQHAIATVNGTAALHTALRLLNIGTNDEVLTPTLTFIATINSIIYQAARPVFIDCDEYLNICPKALESFCQTECTFDGSRLINNQSGAHIKAIMVVHVFGHPANMAAITGLAQKYHLSLLEDAAESLGSRWTSGPYAGKFTGTVGSIGALSFNGNKLITTGSGGMILTQNNKLAQKAKYLTTQAKDDELLFIHNDIGYNYRLSNVQAAIGCAQTEKLEEYIAIKRKNFLRYQSNLSSVAGLKLITEPEGCFSNYWFYTLVINPDIFGKSNIELMHHLRVNRIDTRPIWQLNHLQKPFLNYQKAPITRAIELQAKCLNLPCSVSLTLEDIDRVCEAIITCKK